MGESILLGMLIVSLCSYRESFVARFVFEHCFE